LQKHSRPENQDERERDLTDGKSFAQPEPVPADHTTAGLLEDRVRVHSCGSKRRRDAE
jgi:hypothetical protein